MDVLILGGTKFVGRHITQAFIEAGHNVTLFNRGKTNPELFEGQVEKLIGDRDGGLSPLEGRHWDVCVDVNGYVPRLVRDAITAVDVDHYVFISTISVYEPPLAAGTREDAAKRTLEDETTEEITGETYGGLKVLCEDAVLEAFPEQHTILRPGIVSGPWDHTDRLTYWMHRPTESGTFILPAQPTDYVQTIDARDLAAATLQAVEQPITGVYNVVADAMTWADFIKAVMAVTGAIPNPMVVDTAFWLEEVAEEADGDLPMVIPPDYGAIFQVSNAQVKGQGVSFRPIETTIRDTLAWVADWPEDREWRVGLDAEDEVIEIISE